MENLGIDGKLLIAQLINFVLFYFVFKRFLAKPFSKFIENEKQLEQGKEKLTMELAKKEEELVKKQEALEKELKKKEDKIILEAKKTAEAVKKDILEQAHVEAQQVKEKGQKQAEQMEANIMKKAENRAVELSLFIVEQTLKDVMTPDLKKKVTQAILKSSKAKAS